MSTTAKPLSPAKPRNRSTVPLLGYMREITWRRAAFAFKRSHPDCQQCGNESLFVIGEGDAMVALCQPCRMKWNPAELPLWAEVSP